MLKIQGARKVAPLGSKTGDFVQRSLKSKVKGFIAIRSSKSGDFAQRS